MSSVQIRPPRQSWPAEPDRIQAVRDEVMRQICWTFEAAALILTVSGLVRHFGPGIRSIVSRLWHVPLLGSRLKTTLQKEREDGKETLRWQFVVFDHRGGSPRCV